jgi:hypothetical protein
MDIDITFHYYSEYTLSMEEGRKIAGALCPVYEEMHYELLEQLRTNPRTLANPVSIWIHSSVGRYVCVKMNGESGGTVDAEVTRNGEWLPQDDECHDDAKFTMEVIPLRRGWQRDPAQLPAVITYAA